jgi:hypothetical protein
MSIGCRHTVLVAIEVDQDCRNNLTSMRAVASNVIRCTSREMQEKQTLQQGSTRTDGTSSISSDVQIAELFSHFSS